LPDNVLASRTIILPLIRTPDRRRANADPLDYDLWPHDRQQLIDDLWCLSLSHLGQMKRYETRVNEDARLAGRNLEPWRALLAVAMWLDGQGCDGLWNRIEQLSIDYQQERPNLETNDLTLLTIQALCRTVRLQIPSADDISDVKAISDVKRILGKGKFHLMTETVTAQVQAIIEEGDLDFDRDKVTSRRIGRVLGNMRLKSARQAGKGNRGWVVTLEDLEGRATAYGMSLLNMLKGEKQNVTNVTNGINVTMQGDDLLQGTL